MNTPESDLNQRDNSEAATGLIRKVLDFFREQTDQLTKDVAQFNKERESVQEKIRRGARRTSGRIV